MTAAEGTTRPQGFAVTLPFGHEAARAARSMVGRLLAEQGCPVDLVNDGRLVAHELVSNGVAHGAPDARAEISFSCHVLEAHVVITELDRGSRGSVAPAPPSTSRLSGRGLAIVAALSERWSVDRSDGTKVEAWLSR